MESDPFAAMRGAGEAIAVGEMDRRDASTTDSGTSPATDWMEGEGLREGVGISVVPLVGGFVAVVVGAVGSVVSTGGTTDMAY